MLRFRAPNHTTVVAYLALFVALGGSAYAVARLPANSVGTAQLKKNAVISSKVKDRTITGADLNKLKLGIVPSAAQANNAAHADSATNANGATVAQSALRADTADNATRAGSAGQADTAGDAASLRGKQIAPLVAAAPTGTTNQVAGQAGPVTVMVSCGSGATNQSITVTVKSSVAGTVRSANFHILPDETDSSTVALSAGAQTNVLSNSFSIDTMGFVFTGGGSSVAGHFLADFSHVGGGCLLSGTIGG